MSVALHYWMGDVHHCSGPLSLKWPILCRVGRWTLLYHTIPDWWYAGGRDLTGAWYVLGTVHTGQFVSDKIRLTCWPVMWSEIVGLRRRPVWDKIKSVLVFARSGLGLGLASLLLCCDSETRFCHARHHNDLEGHSNFLSTVYSFSILCLEHHYCGDQQWRSLKS